MLEGRDMAIVEPVKVSRVRQLVSSRLASPELSVEWLAEILRCHADYLSHLFRRETGVTLTRYINEQRIFQAREMLEKSALSVKEITVAVGYSDPGYFARVFRQLTMDSPAAYRVNRAGRQTRFG
jgi:transcriptional regulator GlxA family with amidase domain